MLLWMRQQLLDSESRNQAVWIIGHIPLNNCLQDWAKVYDALVDRFQYTIRGQFFGHTHTDSFQLLTSVNSATQPTGAQFIAPSFTTYSRHNPSFRVFHIDADTMIPVDYDQYRLNLAYWNQYPNATQIEWDLAYSFVEEYGLANMYQFQQLQQLQTQIGSNLTTNTKFYNNYYSGNPSSNITAINKNVYW